MRPARRLRVLLVMRHGGYMRNYETVLTMLAERGHDVRLGLEVRKSKLPGEREVLDRLAARRPTVTEVALPDVGRIRRHRLARALRLALDYVRYFDPEFSGAVALRDRARDLAPAPFRSRAVGALLGSGPGRRLVRAALRRAERAIRWPGEVERFIRKQRPDVVLVTPLVQFGGAQTDYLRAAKHVGVPTGLLVASWDNLTNKGLIHEAPDAVVVWNEEQRDEAVRLHAVPPDRVHVTGANPYDHWFAWSPSSDRQSFRESIGLPVDPPLILYLSSSPFIAQDELLFVQRWLSALRAAEDPLVREAAVLVRPHPLAGPQFEGADLSAWSPAVVWPPAGANPTDEASKSVYFDSIYHAGAVVGLNTSALIESAIVDRPVLTVLEPEFAGTQEGTLHFRYLPRETGGPLLVARGLGEHVRQLSEAMGSDAHVEPNRAFLLHFIRPYGLGEAAAPRVVTAIERLAVTADTRAVSPRAKEPA